MEFNTNSLVPYQSFTQSPSRP